MSGRLFKIQNWETLARQAKFQPGVMAALCPVSLRQLERFFARAFDQTPGEWARKLRCHMACRLVAEGWSNRAVAVELGFGNESHLCHEFKRFYGIPPQAFAPLYGVNHAPMPCRAIPACSQSAVADSNRAAKVTSFPHLRTMSHLDKNIASKGLL
jgi:AraC-like DNA-binding protein